MTDRRSPNARLAKSTYKRRLPHLQTAGATIFVTFATSSRWVLPESVRQLVVDHIVHDDRVRYHLHVAVVMPDHVHVLFTPQTDANGNTFGLAEIMQSIKSTSAHSINRALSRVGRIWQPEYVGRALRSDESLRQKAEYICANPVRGGLAAQEDEWPWLWREWVEGADTE